jgi:isoleucyl-tRNA synthetase
MAGFDAPYVPGWDCHGLPIEIKVDEQLGRKKLEMDPVAVRRACREYAQKYLDLQRSQFIRIGIFGRWNEPYSTMDPEYEARIAETFFHFFEKGFVYKASSPSTGASTTAPPSPRPKSSTRTAHLAQRLRPLQAHHIRPRRHRPALAGKDVYTIIWTTTPWTLPASWPSPSTPRWNTSPSTRDGGVYIVAEALLSTVIVH